MNTIKDRIGRHEVLLPINHNYYNLRKKKGKTYTLKNTKSRYQLIIINTNTFTFTKENIFGRDTVL